MVFKVGASELSLWDIAVLNNMMTVPEEQLWYMTTEKPGAESDCASILRWSIIAVSVSVAQG